MEQYESPTFESLGSLADLTLGHDRKHPQKRREHGFSR